jgi:hypothetical protein
MSHAPTLGWKHIKEEYFLAYVKSILMLKLNPFWNVIESILLHKSYGKIKQFS